MKPYIKILGLKDYLLYQLYSAANIIICLPLRGIGFICGAAGCFMNFVADALPAKTIPIIKCDKLVKRVYQKMGEKYP